MRTTPNEDRNKVPDVDQVASGPKIEFEEPAYGTGSVGPEPEDMLSDAEEEIKGASKKRDSDIEPDTAREPALGTF